MNRQTNDIGHDGPVYRAYVIGLDERVQSAEPLDAETDEAAVQAARRMVDGHVVEIWDRGRKVMRLEPVRRTEPS